MALINTGASFPSYMWAVTRLLLASGRTADVASARLLLTPPSLPAGDSNDEFDVAVKTLLELGFVTVTDGTAELTSPVRALSIDDVTGFNAQLRTAVLDPARNEGLATNPDRAAPGSGPRAVLVPLAGREQPGGLDGDRAVAGGCFPASPSAAVC